MIDAVSVFLFTAWPPANEPLLSWNDPVWTKEAETECGDPDTVSADVGYVHVAVVLVVVPAVPAIGLPPSITKFTLPVGVEALATVAVKVTESP